MCPGTAAGQCVCPWPAPPWAGTDRAGAASQSDPPAGGAGPVHPRCVGDYAPMMAPVRCSSTPAAGIREAIASRSGFAFTSMTVERRRTNCPWPVVRNLAEQNDPRADQRTRYLGQSLAPDSARWAGRRPVIRSAVADQGVFSRSACRRRARRAVTRNCVSRTTPTIATTAPPATAAMNSAVPSGRDPVKPR